MILEPYLKYIVTVNVCYEFQTLVPPSITLLMEDSVRLLYFLEVLFDITSCCHVQGRFLPDPRVCASNEDRLPVQAG